MLARFWLMPLALLAVLCGPPGAAAQRDADAASVDRLIEQLRPGTTRGIRLPREPGVAPEPAMAAPATAAPAAPAAGGPAARRVRPQPEAGVAAIRVRFATGSAALTPDAERSLDILGRALASGELASYRFRIEGHTDRVGANTMNLTLSERRATAVRDYLSARHGIDGARLEVVGRGEEAPEVATADEVPDPRNRRVRVVNLGT